MDNRTQGLGEEYEALMQAALAEPGVATAMDVLRASQASIAAVQYAEVAVFASVGTMPAISATYR